MVRPKVYPDELRERAVRLLQEWRQARGVTDGGYTAIAKQLGLQTRDVAAVDAVRHGDTLTRRLGWYPLVRLNNGRTIWIDAIGFGSPAEPSPENLAMLAQIREPLNVSGEIIPLRSRHRRRTGAV